MGPSAGARACSGARATAQELQPARHTARKQGFSTAEEGGGLGTVPSQPSYGTVGLEMCQVHSSLPHMLIQPHCCALLHATSTLRGAPASCAAGPLSPMCKSFREEGCHQSPRSHSPALQHPSVWLFTRPMKAQPALPQARPSLEELPPRVPLTLAFICWPFPGRAAPALQWKLCLQHTQTQEFPRLSHVPHGVLQRPSTEGPACGALLQACKHPGARAPQQPALAGPGGCA